MKAKKMLVQPFIKMFVAASLVGLSVVLANQAEAAGVDYKILPDTPHNLEAVRLRTTFSGLVQCTGIGFVSMSGNKITVSISCGGGFSSVPPTSFDVELGRFPAGNYTLEVIDPAGAGQTILYATAITVTERHAIPPYNFPVVDYTDHWWNPQESGWGISIMQHPSDRLFAVWFVYNQSGLPVWYTLQAGAWTSHADFTGPVYKTTGPYFGGPFDPNQVGIAQAGTATLSFTDSTSGTFSYMIDGVSGSKSITRLPF